MDRGLAIEDDLAWLRRRGGFYLVGTPKGMLLQFERELLNASWKEIRDGLDVALVRASDLPRACSIPSSGLAFVRAAGRSAQRD